jgi:ribosomal protein L7/L12
MNSGDQISVEMRLAAIEEKLDRLLAHLGLDDDGLGASGYGSGQLAVTAQASALVSTEAELVALIQAGKKIQAIKVYREATGAGLRIAKEAVDTMERNMRESGGRR